MQAIDYDKVWSTEWDDMKKFGPFARHLRRLIMKLIAPLQFESVLDVSCGQGALLREIGAAFPLARLNGTEISVAGLELTQARVPQGQFWPLDLEHARLPQQFDLVICSEVLEHISNDVAAIQNLAAMTAKYLVVSAPHGRMRSREPIAYGHVRNYARGELTAKLSQAGLHVRRVIEWGFPFYSPLYRDFINLTGGKGTTGQYGLGRKVLAQVIFGVFALNSLHRGDEVVILAERA